VRDPLLSRSATPHVPFLDPLNVCGFNAPEVFGPERTAPTLHDELRLVTRDDLPALCLFPPPPDISLSNPIVILASLSTTSHHTPALNTPWHLSSLFLHLLDVCLTTST